jgi:hypothetical protein
LGHTRRFYWAQGEAFECAFAFHRVLGDYARVSRDDAIDLCIRQALAKELDRGEVRKKRGGRFEVGEWHSHRRDGVLLKNPELRAQCRSKTSGHLLISSEEKVELFSAGRKRMWVNSL